MNIIQIPEPLARQQLDILVHLGKRALEVWRASYSAGRDDQIAPVQIGCYAEVSLELGLVPYCSAYIDRVMSAADPYAQEESEDMP